MLDSVWVAPCSGAFVAEPGHCGRQWLQCADVLLVECGSAVAADCWLTALLAVYPGCQVALARHTAGLWCVVALRGLGVLLYQPCLGTTMDRAVAAELGHTIYLSMLRNGGGTDR